LNESFTIPDFLTNNNFMKNLLPVLVVAIFFVSCKDKKTSLESDKTMGMLDSSGAHKSNILTDKGERNEKKHASGSTATDNNNSAVKKDNGNSSTASTPTNTAPASNQDKGWSSAAKGTAIGAASGAVVGAVVSNNKAEGAVIGAVIGGGAGYAIGRSKDRKSGRVARKRAARAASNQ
jgi:hypothetical protein